MFTNLASSVPASEQAALLSFADSFPRKLLDYSVITYLESRSKLAVQGLALIGLLEWSREPVDPEGSGHEHTRKTTRFDRLSRLVAGPSGLFLEIYGWGSATFDGTRLFQTLKNMIVEGVHGAADIVKIDDQEPILEAYLFALQRNITLSPPGLNVEIRFPLEPQLSFVEEVALGFPWIHKLNFTANAGANLEATVSPPINIEFSTAAGAVSVDVSGDLSTEQATEPFTLIGLTGASRISARHFGVIAGIKTSVDAGTGAVTASPSLGLRLQDARVNLDLAGADSFIKQTVSQKELASNFNISATWSMEQGLLFQGSGGVEINLPSHADLGIATVNGLFFKLTFLTDLELEASAGITTQLGPLTATVNRIGLLARLSSQQNNSGNIGPLNLDFAFKPPTALGLSIDGGGFKGGGFLEFEPEEARYSGMLELEFQDQFTLKAFGLLNHALAQRSERLLAADRHQFRVHTDPTGSWVSSSMGWAGLLGLNRTVNIEPLRTGLRDNTLSSILFPTDIVANADRIISDLRQVFPPMAGRFIFGPMAKITWGTPTLVTVDLGLVIEVPEPVRLVILGVLRAVLPDENAAILRVQVNFLGEINFERQQLSFDASLFDSKLLSFTLVRRHGRPARLGRRCQLPADGRRLSSRLSTTADESACDPATDAGAVGGRQSATHTGDVFRGHVQHRAVWRQAGAVCGGVEVQRLRLSHLRRAVSVQSLLLHRRDHGDAGAAGGQFQHRQYQTDADFGRTDTVESAGHGAVQDLLVLHAEGALQQDLRRNAQHDLAGCGRIAAAGGGAVGR